MKLEYSITFFFTNFLYVCPLSSLISVQLDDQNGHLLLKNIYKLRCILLKFVFHNFSGIRQRKPGLLARYMKVISIIFINNNCLLVLNTGLKHNQSCLQFCKAQWINFNLAIIGNCIIVKRELMICQPSTVLGFEFAKIQRPQIFVKISKQFS